MSWELIRLAIKNLGRRRLRSSLTIMGVAVAIAFTVGIISISEGLIVSINRSVEKQGEDIVIFPQGEDLAFLGRSSGFTLPQSLTQDLAALDNIKFIQPVLARPLAVKTDSSLPLPFALQGVKPEFFSEFRPFASVEQGRLLQEGDERVIVITSLLARTLNLGLGDKLEVHGIPLVVVGVLRSESSLDAIYAFAPLAVAQQIYGAEGQISSISIKVSDPALAEETAQRIDKTFPDVSAKTLTEIVSSITDIVTTARAIHLSLSSLSLLIGILFITSTMFMAVSERTKEIATLRALGMPRYLVFRLIIFESLALSIAGGIAGVIGGFILSKVITFVIGQVVGRGYIQPVVTLRLYLTGLVIALLVGALAGLLPAWRVSRRNIVEGLRYE